MSSRLNFSCFLRRKIHGNRLIIERHGEPSEVLRLETELEAKNRKTPPNGLLLKLVAAPVNHADVNFIQGVYPIGKVSLSSGVGFEGVFKVEKQIENSPSPFKTGELVYNPFHFEGSWSERLIADPNHLRPVPPVFDNDVETGTFRINPFTAYRILEDFECLKEGDVVVQNGSSSHIGQAIIQMCAARNITTVNFIRDSSYAEAIKKDLMSLGGSYVFTENQAKAHTFTELVGSDTPKAKLAINIVGDKSVYSLLKAMDRNKTIVTIGSVSKKPLAVPASALIFKNVKFMGFWLNYWMRTNKNETFEKMEKDVFNMYSCRQLKGPLYTKKILINDFGRIFNGETDADSPSKRPIFVPRGN